MAMRGRTTNGRGRMGGRSLGKQKVVFVITLIPVIAIAFVVWMLVHNSPYTRWEGMAAFMTLIVVGSILEFIVGKITKK